MASILTLPVEHNELVTVMVARCGLESMTAVERKTALEHIRITARMMMLVMPDYLAQKRIRM